MYVYIYRHFLYPAQDWDSGRLRRRLGLFALLVPFDLAPIDARAPRLVPLANACVYVSPAIMSLSLALSLSLSHSLSCSRSLALSLLLSLSRSLNKHT